MFFQSVLSVIERMPTRTAPTPNDPSRQATTMRPMPAYSKAASLLRRITRIISVKYAEIKKNVSLSTNELAKFHLVC